MSPPPDEDLPLRGGARLLAGAVDGVVLWVLAKLSPLGLVVAPLYFALGARRGTLGQRAARVRVVARDGSPPGLRQAAARALAPCTLVALGSMPVWGDALFAAGVAAWLAAEAWLHARGWGGGLADLMAETSVRRRPPRGAPASPAPPA